MAHKALGCDCQELGRGCFVPARVGDFGMPEVSRQRKNVAVDVHPLRVPAIDGRRTNVADHVSAVRDGRRELNHAWRKKSNLYAS